MGLTGVANRGRRSDSVWNCDDANRTSMRALSTFVEVLQSHASRSPSRVAFTFLQGNVESGIITYEALDVRARAIGALLQGERLERRYDQYGDSR